MGSLIAFTCERCGYKKSLNVGIGYSYPVEYKKVRRKIYKGEYGEKMRLFLKTNPYRVVEASLELYVCEDCGELQSEMSLDMYVPKNENEEYLKNIDRASMKARNPQIVIGYDLKENYVLYEEYNHRCDNCNGKLKRVIRSYERVKCPKCKKELSEDTVVYWD